MRRYLVAGLLAVLVAALVAALRHGRRFIGIEKEQEYFELALARNRDELR